MGSDQLKCIWFTVIWFSIFSSLSASTIISDDAFGSSSFGERKLLQAVTPCPVNFESQNYTIITSQCRGPDYSPSLCCAALVQFACPHAEYLNDLSNNCASTMFSYITLNGRYPPGLFSRLCREGQWGLSCPPASGASSILQVSPHVLLLASLVMMLLQVM